MLRKRGTRKIGKPDEEKESEKIRKIYEQNKSDWKDESCEFRDEMNESDKKKSRNKKRKNCGKLKTCFLLS